MTTAKDRRPYWRLLTQFVAVSAAISIASAVVSSLGLNDGARAGLQIVLLVLGFASLIWFGVRAFKLDRQAG